MLPIYCRCIPTKLQKVLHIRYALPNLSYPGFHMTGFMTDLMFASQCNESMYFALFSLLFLANPHLTLRVRQATRT